MTVRKKTKPKKKTARMTRVKKKAAVGKKAKKTGKRAAKTRRKTSKTAKQKATARKKPARASTSGIVYHDPRKGLSSFLTRLH